jgi:hypothetical protein
VLRTSAFVIALTVAAVAHASDKVQFGPAGAWVKATPVPAASPGDADKLPLRAVATEFQVKFDDQGELIYQRRAVRFQSPEALPAGAVSLSWKPDTETITVHEVHIIRGGEVIDLLAKGQTFTILRRESDLERAMLNGVLTATLQPEGLQTGDIVEVAYTQARRDPLLHGHSEVLISLYPNAAVDHLRISGAWPTSKPVRWRETEGLNPATVDKSSSGTEVVIDQANAERPKAPKDAPARFNYLSVFEASDFGDWGEISTLLAPLFNKAATLAADSPLKAEAAKIRAASSDPKVQAAAALRLVEDRVRYLFLGMNEGGYVPASADLTWNRRFGDCKGKTAVLLALLHELGIQAEPALVSTVVGDGLNERLPNLEFFNHVLVRAEIDDAVYWLDGTRTGDRSLDDIVVPPFTWALPVRNSSAGLERLSPKPLTKAVIETSLRLDASAGLDAVAPAHAETVFRSDSATVMKLGIASKPASDLEKALRDYWMSLYPWIEVKSVKADYDEAAT